MSDAYSTLKVTRHLPVVDAIRRGWPAPPVHVQVILSDLCNQACAFCAYRDPAYSSSQRFYTIRTRGKGLVRDPKHPERDYNPNRMIDYDKVIEILDDCRELGVRAIQYTGGGEPTIHPRFREIIRETRRRDLQYAIVSNGVAISARNYFDEAARAAWVRISIDAGFESTYTHVRCVPKQHFGHAWNAVEGIAAARIARDTTCVIGVGFVVTPDNWREVKEATRRAKNAGADNIRISGQFSTADERLFTDFHAECAALCAEAKAEYDGDGFRVYERFSEKLDDLRLKRPDYQRCGYQFVTTYIGADLTVYRCCVTAYNDAGDIGSIENQRFADLWMSQERAAEMRSFDARSCDRCQFNRINRVLEYTLAADDPAHAEFV